MKQLFIMSICIFLTINLFAQKADTLFVPTGKYGFIKIDDKIYKVITTLELAPAEPIFKLWNSIVPAVTFIGTETRDSIRRAERHTLENR